MDNFFIKWLKRRGSYRFILRDENGTMVPYLDRFYLFSTRLVSIFLHCFLSSDPDGVHCHPWHNISLVLTTGYWERHHDGLKSWRGPGAFVFRSARELHRVELLKDENGNEIPAWTIFIHLKRFRHWGFYKLPGVDFNPAEDSTTWKMYKGTFFPKKEDQ